MSVAYPPTMSPLDYERAALDYMRRLPLEHFMEATPQATQREITVTSFALLHTRRPDIQYFNELLVQYRFEGTLGQVVPDNMVIVSPERSQARTNYAVEHEPVGPFMVMEYVSPRSRRKDYEESFRKYERELMVPYCLMYHPDNQDLRVHRHDGERYVRLEPDREGRCAIGELDLQVGLHDGWVRFWYQGELLEVPAELQQRLERQAEQIHQQTQRIDQQTQRIDQQTQRIDQQTHQIDQQTQRIDQQTHQIDHLQGQLRHMLSALRLLVEQRARQAGRQDILVLLPSTTDADQLQRWLAELA